MKEIWKPVAGHEKKYEVSNRGRVRSLNHIRKQKNRWGRFQSYTKIGQILKPGRMPSGHLSVAIGRQNSVCVHTLVLEAFISLRPVGMECRHKNGKPEDNRLSNLAWGTRSQNLKDKKWHLAHWKLSVPDVKNIKQALKNPYYGIGADLAKHYSVSQATISAIKKGVFHSDVIP